MEATLCIIILIDDRISKCSNNCSNKVFLIEGYIWNQFDHRMQYIDNNILIMIYCLAMNFFFFFFPYFFSLLNHTHRTYNELPYR